MKVESSTLRAKANSIVTGYPTLSSSAVPPCMLTISGQAMQKLDQNYQNLVSTLAAGRAEAARLAACLQAAADAYDKADAEAKAAVDSGGPSGGAPVPVNPNLPPSAPASVTGKCTPPPQDDGLDWPTAVAQFDAGDQCASLMEFVSALRQFADQLTDHGKKFSMGDTHWEGAAAEGAEDALRRHESWLYDLAEQTRELAKQGNDFADAHLSEHSQHPTAQDVATVSELTGSDWAYVYSAMQEKSDEVRRSYASRVDFADMMFKEPPSGAYPSAAVSPDDVATASYLKDAIEKKDPTGGPSSGGGSTGGGGGGQPSAGGVPQAASPSTNPAAAQEQPQESGGEKAGGGSGGGSPSGSEGGGSPSGGEGAGAGGGLPGGLGGGLGDGLGDGTGLGSGLPDDGGLKPASTGGGGAGGGLGSQPLQPAASAPAMGTSAASTGAGPGGVGGGRAGGGAMGGGMGGGMGGMGHGNREGGKEKKRNPNLSPEESLYVEDRPYTDPVIGHTRRTKIDDKKETK
jgi:hypothetical protein